MRHQARRSATLIFAAALGAAVLTPVSAAATTHPAGAARALAALASWGTAQEVPGLGALNKRGGASIGSMSCPSPGNCSAGGNYLDGAAHYQAFVVNEVNGVWQNAEKVPGALNQGQFASTGSVSCASAGNCSAGGEYTDSAGHHQAFVVNETHGVWRKAVEVPGTAALNQGGNADLGSVSCASVRNCSAGGEYTDGSGHQQVFVVNKINGTWQNARKVPGTATLNRGGFARLDSVSCTSGGNCSAGGEYTDRSENRQVFVVSRTNGIWQNAEEVPGTATLNQGGGANLYSVSCTSPGNCSAGGYYQPALFQYQAFVVSETNGVWQNAEEVPGIATLNQREDALTQPVSCASAGNCSAGGYYTDGSGGVQAFVVSEVNGVWQNAEEVPGTAALNQDGKAELDALSCASAGNCSAGGSYRDGSGNFQAFVVSEVNGVWQSAEEVPGFAALNQGGQAGALGSVSCASAGNCSAAGIYSDSSGVQAFVVSES
jgi:hypothetical protein